MIYVTLTFALLLVILLAGRFGWRFPTININWDINLRLPPSVEKADETLPPMPVEILQYIQLESDEWARNSRRARAQRLFAEVRSWDSVLHMLRMEDNIS